jgi:hypothetical protein
MQINDGTEPRQDENVIIPHDCTDYANVRCGCQSGECEQRFRNGKLGDNDLENFTRTQLIQIKASVDYVIDERLKSQIPHSNYMIDTLQTLKSMLNNAINKAKTKS